jgi:3-methyladenine DNA glycosylase AlkD
MQDALDEVESAMARLAGVRRGSLRFGLTVPKIRKRFKEGYSFSGASELQAWDFIWKNSRCFEARSQSLYFLQGRSLTRKEFDLARQWVSGLSCWEHSDDLSKSYAGVTEENPGWILPWLERWNRSPSLWARRQSVVSLLEYASKRRKVLPFPQLIRFVDKLLEDEEYYVQKGVGWTLREIYNVYPRETLAYLRENLSRIRPLAYSPATEKLSLELKAELRLERKRARGLRG